MPTYNFLRLNDLIQQGRVTDKRVFVRSDLNVPFDENGQITDDSRIRAALPCINALLDVNAAIMLTSHLGRPTEGTWSKKDSLLPVAKRLESFLNKPVTLVMDWIDNESLIQKIQPRNGEIFLLENCRLNIGEKKDSLDLAKKMAKMCDVYVNDAFGTAHRAEATTSALPKIAALACAGPLLSSEIDAINRAMQFPVHPILAIVAGSKVSTKLTILRSLINKVDKLVLGGGIANTFLLASGNKIGKSLCELPLCSEASVVIDDAKKLGVEIVLPRDVVTGKEFSSHTKGTVKYLNDIEVDDMIMDFGPVSSKYVSDLVEKSGTIIWNGPVGVFEFDEFALGTQVIGKAIASSKGYSLAGGGDTVAAITKFGLEKKGINYISTGGGAFLECLEDKNLPAICALENSVKT